MADRDRVIAALEVREKVRRALKCHSELGCYTDDGDEREECPYFGTKCNWMYDDMAHILEPMPAIYDEERHVSVCPECFRLMDKTFRFCPTCGREVVWNGN